MKRELLDNTLVIPDVIAAALDQGAGEIISDVVIDRDDMLSAVAGVLVKTLTGAPASAALTLKVMSGDQEDGSDMAYTDDELAVAHPSVDIEADVIAQYQIDLVGLKRYIKPVLVVAFDGGTTPTVSLSGLAVALGDPKDAPVSL